MTELRYAVAPIEGVEVRDTSGTGDNTWKMSGYAAVFNETTTLLDSKFIRLTESIDAGAFRNALANQGLNTADGVVHFNFGHDMNRAVAATDVPEGPGSLKLSADRRGLYFEAKVPRDDPDGIAMAAKMRSGVLKQASFAFTVADSDYTFEEREDGPDVEHRTILEIGHLYDVCATTQGAYSSTEAGLRSYGAALGQPTETIVDGRHRQSDSGGEIPVSDPAEEGDGGESNMPLEWPDDLEAQAMRRRPISMVPSTEGAIDAGGNTSG